LSRSLEDQALCENVVQRLFSWRECREQKTKEKKSPECELPKITIRGARETDSAPLEISHFELKSSFGGSGLPHRALKQCEVKPAHHEDQKSDSRGLAVYGGEPGPGIAGRNCATFDQRYEDHERRDHGNQQRIEDVGNRAEPKSGVDGGAANDRYGGCRSFAFAESGDRLSTRGADPRLVAQWLPAMWATGRVVSQADFQFAQVFLTTRQLAIMSCSACFFSVKPAMI